MMIPIVLNRNFEAVGMIDDYVSFIWTTRFYSPGDFQLTLPITEKTLSIIQKDFYVARDDLGFEDELGIIESIEYVRDNDGTKQMIVSGRFLSSIVGRRIIGDYTVFYNMTVPEVISEFIRRNITEPADEWRRLSNFVCVDESGNTDRITIQRTYENLLETITGLCAVHKIGFRCIYENGTFKFKLISGVDRSESQSVNPRVVFSAEYDNLISSDYLENYADTVTNVLVGGEGDVPNKFVRWSDMNYSGSALNIREIYLDSSNSSRDGETITSADYAAMLEEEGKAHVTEFSKAFSGEVIFENINFRTDLNVGDTVTVKNTEWNISADVQLVEVIESVIESGEYSIVPTFGS